MINIYIADVSNINAEDKGLLSMLPEKRRRKVEMLLLPEKKRLCAGVGLLLRHAFKCCGLPQDTPVFEDRGGKPRSENMFFSLSHSEKYALCAVASCEIGADIEKINPAQHMETAKKFCTESELRGINTDKFFRIFTAKESYLKMTGEGLARDMRTFCAADIENLQTFEFKGYMISVCTQKAQGIKLDEISLF